MLAGGHLELGVDQVDAGGQLGDRVLDLEPGVHLQEVEPVRGRLVEELDGAGVLVVGRPGDVAGRLAQRHPHLLGQAGGRGLLDSFGGVAGASSRARPGTPPRRARRPGPGPRRGGGVQVALDVDLVAAEGGPGLAPGRLPARRPRRRPCGPPSCPGRRRRRPPCWPAGVVAVAEGHRRARAGQRLHRARDQRRLGLLGDPAGRDLVAHGRDRGRLGPDPAQPGVQHRLGEGGVLGQEPAARGGRRRPRPGGPPRPARRRSGSLAGAASPMCQASSATSTWRASRSASE